MYNIYIYIISSNYVICNCLADCRNFLEKTNNVIY